MMLLKLRSAAGHLVRGAAVVAIDAGNALGAAIYDVGDAVDPKPPRKRKPKLVALSSEELLTREEWMEANQLKPPP